MDILQANVGSDLFRASYASTEECCSAPERSTRGGFHQKMRWPPHPQSWLPKREPALRVQAWCVCDAAARKLGRACCPAAVPCPQCRCTAEVANAWAPGCTRSHPGQTRCTQPGEGAWEGNGQGRALEVSGKAVKGHGHQHPHTCSNCDMCSSAFCLSVILQCLGGRPGVCR